jgi:hypothetical protein
MNYCWSAFAEDKLGGNDEAGRFSGEIDVAPAT